MDDIKTRKRKTLIVEGNVGAGKSTLLQLLQKHLDVEIVYEPHTQWQSVGGSGNILEKFYADPHRWAYTFQTYAFVTRIVAQNTMNMQRGNMCNIVERSVYADRYCFAKNCYQTGVMSSLEWHLYTQWFSWLVQSYTHKPDGFIYLRVEPEVCYQRMLLRNRSEEATVTREYLEQIHQRHEQWLKDKQMDEFLSDVPVLVLDGSQDFEHSDATLHAHVDKVADFYGLTPRVLSKTVDSGSRACRL